MQSNETYLQNKDIQKNIERLKKGQIEHQIKSNLQKHGITLNSRTYKQALQVAESELKNDKLKIERKPEVFKTKPRKRDTSKQILTTGSEINEGNKGGNAKTTTRSRESNSRRE